MVSIHTIPVTDVNGVFRFYKFNVAGDDSANDFKQYRLDSIDLSNAPGDDTFFGACGNDTIDGGGGSDSLDGGSGNDRFMQKDFSGSDTINGGGGTDTVDYSQAGDAANSIVVDFLSGFKVSKRLDDVVIGVDQLQKIESIVGTSNDDVVRSGGYAGISLSLDGGAGFDSLSYRERLPDGARIHLNLALGTVIKYSAAGREIGRERVSHFEDVTGSLQNDTMSGSPSADLLDGANGNDLISGGAGDDELHGDSGNDTIVGGSGNDTLRGGEGKDSVSGGDGNDLLVQDFLHESQDTLDGGAGFDTVDFSLANDGGASSQAAQAAQAAQADSAVIDYSAGGIIRTEKFRSIESVVGSRYNDSIVGSTSAEQLDGAGGNDSLNGNGGNDTLEGGVGDDTLNGGAGSDAMRGMSGDDRIVLSLLVSDDTIDGGTGNDVADYSGLQAGGLGISVNLRAGAVQKYVAAGGFGAVLVGTDTVRNIETVLGSPNNDDLQGDDTGNGLFGGAGADLLYGFGGNDTLTGGAGSDRLLGGDGDDLMLQDQTADADMMAGGDGLDTADYSQLDQTGGSIIVNMATHSVQKQRDGQTTGIDALESVERILGTAHNDCFTGAENADFFSGGDGGDSLSGGDANDTLNGDGGNDLLMGQAGDDMLSGGAGDDVLNGGAGSDSIRGDDGNDLIAVDGFHGTKTIDGGRGNDTVDYSSLLAPDTHIVVYFDDGNAVVYRGQGIDGDGTDLLFRVETIIGSAGNDIMTIFGGGKRLDGNAGDDTLVGGTGADTLLGGAGSDQISAGDSDDRIVQDPSSGSDTIDGGSGNDTLDYHQCANAGLSVGIDVAAGTASRFQNGVLVGIDFFSNIEHIIDQNDIELGIAPLRDMPQTQAAEAQISIDASLGAAGQVIALLIAQAPALVPL